MINIMRSNATIIHLRNTYHYLTGIDNMNIFLALKSPSTLQIARSITILKSNLLYLPILQSNQN